VLQQVIQEAKLDAIKEADLISARHLARSYAKGIGLGLVEETKLVTAVSELTRNLIVHGKGGTVYFTAIEDNQRKGVRIVFEDFGPGIADIKLAMTEGVSSIKSMGMGLPGSKRLVNEFEIKSEVGKGTQLTIVKWN
jgi:serine/threonine-protein kinase RsbT